MKAVKIAFFTFMLFFSLALVNEIGLFTSQKFETGWATNSIESSVNTAVSQDYTKRSMEEMAQAQYGDFWTSLALFTQTFNIFIRSSAYATVGIPLLLAHFGFPAIYGTTIAVFVNLNYLIAIMQILGRFGFKGGM